MKRKSLCFAEALLCCLIALTAGGWTQTVAPLFFIARNKNANRVYYEARLTKAGTLDTIQPIHAYWILWAKDSTGAVREELNEIEKKLAYGFTYSKCAATSCVLRLAGFRGRAIEVRFLGTTPCAVTTIAGRPSYLTKIFVVTLASGMIIPRVSSTTLYGNDTASGDPKWEVITPR